MDRNAPSMISFAATTVTFPASAFVPLAVGFFGLGTGYLIYGPEELFGLPQRSRSVDLTTGLWGIWMPGFMQFLTGVYLWVGLLWFHSFRAPTLYMAALAFTAFGVHWFSLGLSRMLGGDPRPNEFMAVPFCLLSALGTVVFFKGRRLARRVALRRTYLRLRQRVLRVDVHAPTTAHHRRADAAERLRRASAGFLPPPHGLLAHVPHLRCDAQRSQRHPPLPVRAGLPGGDRRAP